MSSPPLISLPPKAAIEDFATVLACRWRRIEFLLTMGYNKQKNTAESREAAAYYPTLLHASCLVQGRRDVRS